MPIIRKQVSLDEAQPGMVLSDALLDAHGNVMLAAGMELSASTIAALRRHQIESLSIAAGMLSEEELEGRRRRDVARLEHLFRKQGGGDTDASDLLHALMRRYRLGEEPA